MFNIETVKNYFSLVSKTRYNPSFKRATRTLRLLLRIIAALPAASELWA